MLKKRTITIDGTPCDFADGETILAVARRHGIDIPTLCHLKGVTPTGACRICVVEVEKARSLMASCALPAADGMVVLTESAKVVKSLKIVLELLLSSGRHDCVICAGAGECRLQEWPRYGVAGQNSADRAAPNLRPNPSPRATSGASCCAACRPVPRPGQRCPISYRGEEWSSRMYRDGSACLRRVRSGLPCPRVNTAQRKVHPGRARERTTCATARAAALPTRHDNGSSMSPVEEAARTSEPCVGAVRYDFVGHPDRLKTPLIREGEGFREASWDEALGLVAARLGAIRDADGANAIGVLSSARASNESNYVVQKFARGVLKTNNVDHCARL
jgi:predicted molibdopterin-dependent oxidoreductase YjgC